MTLEEIRSSDKAFLTPRDIAQVLGCNPYSINLMVRDAPERLRFPTCMIGKRVKIPRIPFLRFMEGGE